MTLTSAALGHPDAQAPVAELVRVSKRFPGVLANDAVDLVLKPGEVHALLGENGAGKSTLIGLLSGLQQPDEGEIRIGGVPTRIGSPREALAAGVGTVFQHTMLVPTLSVADNLILGEAWWRRPATAELARRVAELGGTFGFEVNLDAPAGDLSLGQQQQVEILRALLRRSRLLILDEPTSMLTPQGIEQLGALMRRLVERGLAILFVTHKLGEAIRFGDRVTVLRLGRKVGEIPPERLRALEEGQATREIVQLMFGAGGPESSGERPNRVATRTAEPVLEVRNLSVASGSGGAHVDDMSFEVAAGEILGIAGIDGNGQSQLAEALAGQRALASGHIALSGIPIERESVRARRKLGLRYLSDDRMGEGTVAAFPLSLNTVLKEIGAAPFWRHGLEQTNAIAAHARALVAANDVRTPGVDTPIGRLSGGNIQKVMLARELAPGARLVIFNKPTYGLDAHNTVAFRRRIREIAQAGIGVLLISTELDELLELCDRIAVMARGRLVGTVRNGAGARHEVGRLMVGAGP